MALTHCPHGLLLDFGGVVFETQKATYRSRGRWHVRCAKCFCAAATTCPRTSWPASSGPRAGETIPVSTDTHVTGVLVHESGVLSTLVMSFDAVATSAHPIEIHGTEGTLAVPDPNHFSGEVTVRRLAGEGWEALPVTGGYEDAGRGIGLQDMAVRGAELRASGELGQHVLEVMNAVLESAHSGARIEIASTVARPEAVRATAHRSPVG